MGGNLLLEGEGTGKSEKRGGEGHGGGNVKGQKVMNVE